MADYFEIDFQDVKTSKSGDAICLRYEVNGQTFIHVVDGGYQSVGEKLVAHIRKFYDNPKKIDHVVATHNDGDHAGGLRTVLEEFDIGALWMLRPWLYAAELIDKFSYYSNPESLANHLREVYSNLAALEDIADKRGIPIYEPFQGAAIGKFTVMAPSKSRFLDLIISSDKTPQVVKQETGLQTFGAMFKEAAVTAMQYIASLWGEEIFPSGDTSAENEMSVVQYANLCETKILLTADTGRDGLQEVIDFAPMVGLILPGIDRFQVPHHGGRRNVNTELLDKLLGPRITSKSDSIKFTAIISAAKDDEHHPRNSVVRAMYHRGGFVGSTEDGSKSCVANAPQRGWHPITPLPYPEQQEDI